MFELSVACKYLTPRWRQLSVSIISLISILVIALVVWLIVVFFSVTHGLEKAWVQKLVALTAPVRITPTDAYYASYYYHVDSISAASNYALKSIGEKRSATQTDPYDPNFDEEPPSQWQSLPRNADGTAKDPVKQAFQIISTIPGATARDYEMTAGNLRLRLVRDGVAGQQNQAFLSQVTYLGSFDPDNPSLPRSISTVTMDDLNNILKMLSVTSDNIQEDRPEALYQMDSPSMQRQLSRFFQSTSVQALKTPSEGWQIPKQLLPESVQWRGALVSNAEGKQLYVLIPTQAQQVDHLEKNEVRDGYFVQPVDVAIQNGKITLTTDEPLLQQHQLPLVIPGNILIPASLLETSIEKAKRAQDVRFAIAMPVQGTTIQGIVNYGRLTIGKAELRQQYSEQPVATPFWPYQISDAGHATQMILPTDPIAGEGILLPKNFRESGVLVGDRGYLAYSTPTASALQEQRLPIYVANFYDPGIIPIGGKFVIANQSVTNLIRSSHNQEGTLQSNGINVRFDNLDRADQIKADLTKAFETAGIAPYWHIETFREFEFARDLIQQLRSDRNLWTLIATVIIIVACSNIVSMLIILVNDKKTEIGILRSMGASSASIAAIFGICGVVMGMVGSVIGTLVAIVTLKNIQALVSFISRIQGHEMLNPMFYGDTLPNEISYEALAFVIIATSITSLLAGIIPAMKASLMRPATILRAE